ncbi:MAG: rhodanese-like domain-containing protein [Spirochaetales bacterium]|nr:rhodanese-like domain-containing protein [Spirochaetales bacterium]MCF7937279.1 rhodanese-like domain-containing protein [Spirochaetales bacterium]
MKKLFPILLVLLLVLSAATVTAKGQQEGAQGEQQAQEAAEPAVDVTELAKDYFDEYPQGGYIIKEEMLLEKLQNGEDMFVIDIRQPDAYAEAHVTGAVNMPWGPDFAQYLASIPQSGQVYLYCYSGQTAGQTVALLNLAGIPVKSVRYGFNYGFSKVEGADEFIDTTEVAVPSANNEIAPAVQETVDAYYKEFEELAGTPFANNIISSENAKKILDAEDDSVQFVDIRRKEDYDQGHIETAVNIPYGADMHEMFGSLPADKKLIVNCYSGQTAGQTVAILKVIGYDAASLKGGMGTPKNEPMGWVTEGYPVVQ